MRLIVGRSGWILESVVSFNEAFHVEYKSYTGSLISPAGHC